MGYVVGVPDPGKGVCADPVNGAAILGKEGPDPQGRNKGCQLSPGQGKREDVRRRQEDKDDDPAWYCDASMHRVS